MTSLSFDELPTRLDKYVRESTDLSRRGVEDAVQADRVTVDEARPRHGSATLIFPEDVVRVDGAKVIRRPAGSYYIFHKPAGILTASSDPYGRPCLSEYLEELPARVFPVGRLDKDTTGLLFLIDDGDLAHMLLHPKFHIPKTYRADLSDELEPRDPRLEHLVEGVEILDGPAKALSARLLEGDAPGGSRIAITIDEGRNRQVRRMVRAAGLNLEHLHRQAFGELELDIETAGEFRELGPDEVEALWKGVGGRQRVVRRKLRALEAQAIRLRDGGRPHVRLEDWLRSETCILARHD